MHGGYSDSTIQGISLNYPQGTEQQNDLWNEICCLEYAKEGVSVRTRLSTKTVVSKKHFFISFTRHTPTNHDQRSAMDLFYLELVTFSDTGTGLPVSLKKSEYSLRTKRLLHTHCFLHIVEYNEEGVSSYFLFPPSLRHAFRSRSSSARSICLSLRRNNPWSVLASRIVRFVRPRIRRMRIMVFSRLNTG